MKRARLLLVTGAAGALLLAWLLARQDWSDFGPALLAVGWGMAWITLFHVLPMLIDALGWRCLLPRQHRPGLGALLEMRWYGESVNGLLPAAQIGGDLLRGRLAQRAGVPGPAAGGGGGAGPALSVLSLVVFIAIGAALLGQRGQSALAAATLAGGASLAGASLAAVWLLRQAGTMDGWLWRLTHRIQDPGWLKLAGHATALRDSLRAITADWRRPAASTAWQFMAWIAGAGEIWLAAEFLGHPLSVADAVLLESLLQAIRNAAFPVPGALGVQDGGLMILAPLVGLGPETGLAISLLKRVRELMLGVPGLAVLYLRSWRYLAVSG